MRTKYKSPHAKVEVRCQEQETCECKEQIAPGRLISVHCGYVWNAFRKTRSARKEYAVATHKGAQLTE